jgi:hypothetical protein
MRPNSRFEEKVTSFSLSSISSYAGSFVNEAMYVVCLKSSVNGSRKQTKQSYKQINFIGLQNNSHPSQHTVGNFHRASENCQQMPLLESIAEPL